MRGLLAGLIVISLLAPAGLAQDAPAPGKQPQVNPRTAPPPPPAAQQGAGSRKAVIRTTVDLVLIDVRVTDKAGKPIFGLKPEQFTLLEDDKPQKIGSFEYYNIEAIEAAAKPDSKPVVVALGSIAPPEEVQKIVRDHRLLVLFFDLTSMQPEDLLRARNAAERYLLEQITPADLVAIATFGNQIKVQAHFTNNRDTLLRVIRSLRPGKEAQLAEFFEAAAQQGEDPVSEDTGAAYTPDAAEFNIFNTDRKLAAMESLANLLRPIPGRKSVVQFTSGIAQTGEENRSQLRAAVDAANRANVSFYTVDARGLFSQPPGGEARQGTLGGTAMSSGIGGLGGATGRASQASSRATGTGVAVYHQSGSRQASRETLATLAADTGGRSFFDLGDFRDVFQKVQADTPGYYLVGYYSTNSQRNGRWRRVRVKVDAPGARVHYREGYYAPRDLGLATAQDRERALIEAMRAEAPRVEFPIALETAYFRLNERESFVPIAAKLPWSALEWATKRGKREAEFDFAAEVRDQQSNKIVGALRDTIKVSLATDRFQQLQQHALLYQGGLILGPGNYRMKFLARENETGRIGSFEEDLLIPKLDAGKIELSSVLLSSQIERVSDTSEVKRKSLGTDPRLKVTVLEVSGERIVPSVTHVFTNKQELYVFFQAYLPVGVDGSKTQAGLAFYRNGEYVSETPLVEPAAVDAKARTASFRIGLPLDKLPPGSYTVQAVVVQDGGEQAGFARSYFAVRPAPTAR
jgi:VWFA-related protein